MKTLRVIFIVILIIVILPLTAALFVKKDYTVEREIIINKPIDEVFNYVKYLKNQNEFSKWANIDPEMKTSFSGTDGQAGFISAWDSDNKQVGKGEQEIKNIEEGERIDYEIRFIEPFPSVSPAYMITESVDENQTKVRWGFSGHMKYPINLMLLFMDFENLIGKDFETGLNNLKDKLEE